MSRSSNPFDTGEEDDFVLVDGSKNYGGGAYSNNYGNNFTDPPEGRMSQMQASENRQLESTRRALASIYESESMGNATAEELVRQGEQLDNVERKTDHINQTLKTSERHLNNIKSVFGGIKNWWNKKPDTQTDVPTRESKLRDQVDIHRETSTHPALRIRSDDTKGFYEDDDDLTDRQFMGKGKSLYASASQSSYQKISRSDDEQKLHQNLDMMSDGMARLKDMALNLGDEIEAQNDQLDRINTKMDPTNVKLEAQTREMNKILYK